MVAYGRLEFAAVWLGDFCQYGHSSRAAPSQFGSDNVGQFLPAKLASTRVPTLSDSIKILNSMVEKQHIDGDIFRLFLSSGIYKKYSDKFLKPEQNDEVDVTKYI